MQPDNLFMLSANRPEQILLHFMVTVWGGSSFMLFIHLVSCTGTILAMGKIIEFYNQKQENISIFGTHVSVFKYGLLDFPAFQVLLVAF